MAVQSNKQAEPKKRKNPPTFSHLPRNRAQKLKKSWIDKKKLKIRWKAQKRREGLDSGWPTRSRTLRTEVDAEFSEVELEKVDERSRTQNDDSASSSSSSNTDNDAVKPGDSERPPLPRRKAQVNVPRLDDSRHASAKSKGKQADQAKSSRKDNSKKGTGEPEDPKPSLRELARQAYAPSSLHTFKADPLHRRREAVAPKGSHHTGHAKDGSRRPDRTGKAQFKAPLRAGRGGRGTERERQRQPRGQPNMKLRMEAMLERIKRDYS